MTTLEKLANGFLQESLIDSALQNTLASMWSFRVWKIYHHLANWSCETLDKLSLWR